MIYLSTISTPVNVLKSNPLKTIVKIARGLIYQVDIYFPPGSSGLAGINVTENNIQLYPRNRGDFFIGDNVQISFPDLHMTESENNILDVYTYNEDTAYDHQIQIRFGIVAREDFISSFVPELAFSKLNNSIDTLNKNIETIQSEKSKKTFSLFGRRV